LGIKVNALALDSHMVGVRVHGRRVVTPNAELLNIGGLAVELFSNLGESTIVVKSSHSVEVLLRKVLGIVRSNETVGVGWVTDDQGLAVSSGVVIDGLSSVNENLSVVLEKITSLHSWTSWLGTNEHVVVGVLETNSRVASADNSMEKRESAVIELHLNTSKLFLSIWKIDQMKNDWLIRTKHFTVGDSEGDSVTNVSGSTGDRDSDWSLPLSFRSNEVGTSGKSVQSS